MKAGKKAARTKDLAAILKKEYPGVGTALIFENQLQLLIATILSAQCTDTTVNKVTANLFRKYHKAADFARKSSAELEKEIRPTGFYRNKAKNIIACCRILDDDYAGEIPQSMDKLTSLPGVGRKTANVVLGNGFGIPGIVVDTHVKRIAYRLGLTKNTDPVKIEFDLMKIIDKKDWIVISNALIRHGRAICVARKPLCDRCPVKYLCPRIGV